MILVTHGSMNNSLNGSYDSPNTNSMCLSFILNSVAINFPSCKLCGLCSMIGSSDVPITTFLGSVSYRSIGVESDLLLQAMDEVYGTKKAPKAMNKVTEFSAISLEGDPKNLTKGLVKIKLFFESNSEDQYAELFTNIDLTARKLYISEKDEEYRSAIVRALQAP